MTTASQSKSEAAAGTVELGLLDDIVAKSKVAKTTTERPRQRHHWRARQGSAARHGGGIRQPVGNWMRASLSLTS
jgi:hypothetical protein